MDQSKVCVCVCVFVCFDCVVSIPAINVRFLFLSGLRTLLRTSTRGT